MKKKQRKTIIDIKNQKGEEPLVCLTAYTAPVAEILDKHVDVLLVGDSVGMVLYGMDSTLPVTMDIMCAHGTAVVNASEKALVVVDMPFMSYQMGPEQALGNAARLMAETGCGAVKLEGGIEMAETIWFLNERGIPVMAHIGLKPQSVHTAGGYKYQGRGYKEKERIKQDALAVQEAGAFAVVLESITEGLATDITKSVNIPTIGIGASPNCDGQILVTEDMAGLFDETPKFVKKYGNMRKLLDSAAKKYAKETRSREFPDESHCFDNGRMQLAANNG